MITEGNVSDFRGARQFHFDPGTIVVADRGYNDYASFGLWTAQDVCFVTRMAINKAGEIASGVKGVKSVKNNLNVKK